MPEFRKDPVTGQWVIIASERARRPSAFVVEKTPMIEGECPFCPGHEDHTPNEVLAYRPPHSKPDEPGWWVRVVPNKFPALSMHEALERSGDGMYDRITGIGGHEVVIENPGHEVGVADMPVEQVQEIIWAYRDRLLAIRDDPRIEYVMIFKNHLIEAGASLRHAHSQIISLPIVPKRAQEELAGAREYFRYKERCVYCDMLAQETRAGRRIVMETDHFTAFVPFAAVQPFECWILPKRHAAFFHDIKKAEVVDMAKILHGVMERLKDVLKDPPFNWMIHALPLRESNERFYHWHMKILPKTTRLAGFEWGTGFYINPLAPEEAATYLQSSAKIAELFPGTEEAGA